MAKTSRIVFSNLRTPSGKVASKVVPVRRLQRKRRSREYGRRAGQETLKLLRGEIQLTGQR